MINAQPVTSPTWRPLVCMLVGVVFVLATPRVANAHAMLMSSTPVSGSTVRSSPGQVRLVFSEALDAALDRMTLVTSTGDRTVLHVSADPHDVHALIAPLQTLRPGTYWVVWRVVSADGHVVGGTLVFAVGSAPPDTSARARAVTSSPIASADIEAVGPMAAGAPILAAALRGAAVGCLMALVGLLVLAAWMGGAPPTRVTRLIRWLAVAAFALFVAHLLVWLADTAPGNQLDAGWVLSALATSTGAAETVRCGLALLTIWALLLVRRSGLAAGFATGALIVSAFVGHAATHDPAWAVPAKVLHLFAVGAWIGGLLLLLLLDRADPRAYLRAVDRVSVVALGAVAVVLTTGVILTLVATPSLSLLIRSAYGALVAAKLAGLAVLVGFGAYHRTRGIPRLRATNGASPFQRTLAREVVVMFVVVLLGGWLAYVPPPAVAPSSVASSPSSEDSSP